MSDKRDTFTQTVDAAALYERLHSDPGYDPRDDWPDERDAHMCKPGCRCGEWGS